MTYWCISTATAVPESDHLTLLNVYLQWKNNQCVLLIAEQW